MDTSKIIKGVVNSGRYTVTAPIMQEHYGIILKIEGAELPETYQVDFSNDEHHGTSVTMIGNADGVLIPRQFIDTGKDVFAFLYWVGEDYGKTVYKFRIPNKCRPDRTDDTPTPEEQSVIDQAISALNTAVAQTAHDVIDADASAQSASADAERAEEARTDAQNYATQAEQSATDASQSALQANASATASAQSASQSAQIKADVEDLVDDAQGYAQASERSASASANSASQAQGYAQSASSSAQSASGYASNAQTSANTASEKAQDASTSAQTATQKATESAQSASLALEYKNDAETAKTASQTAQGLAESARDSAVQAKTDAESAKDDAESARDEAQQAVASISGALADKAPVITDTASGSIASFSDGADDLPLKSLVVDINPIQDLHGQDSPYPAGGGKNLFDANTAVQGYFISDDNGELMPWDASYASDYIEVDAGQTYCISPTLSSGNWGAWYDENKAFISGFTGYATAKTAPSNAKYLRFTVSRNGSNPNYATTTQVEKGSTATAWSPYENICPISGWTEVDVNHSGADMTNPTTLTINLGQTVYGGHLDVISGVLTVDRAMVDLGTLTYTVSNHAVLGQYFYASITALRVKYEGAFGSILYNALCSAYKVVPRSHTYLVNGTFCFDGNQINEQVTQIQIKNTAYTDAATFKAAMSGVQLCYELATPIEIQLSANQLNSLYGVNNIWADTGDVNVEYRADTKLYIERLTAPDSADMIADSNIVSGQYFMVGNNLYKATANIANGGQITVGTNCTKVSLAQALNEINT